MTQIFRSNFILCFLLALFPVSANAQFPIPLPGQTPATNKPKSTKPALPKQAKESDSKVNEDYYSGLQIEMRGIALSDLKPIGKGEFNHKTYEVRSSGEHIASGSSIKITKVEGNKIIVETITTS